MNGKMMLDFLKKSKKNHIEIELRMPSGQIVRQRIKVKEGEFLDAVLEAEKIVSDALRREFERNDDSGC